MTRILTPLLFAGILLAGGAHAAAPSGKFAVKGAGITRCGHYVKQVKGKTSEFYAYAGWLEGYLTAVNAYEKDTFDIAPWQNTKLLALMLANYCTKKPEEPFALAVRKMVLALRPTRLKRESKLVLARNGDKAIRIYRTVLEQIQTRLRQRGLYKGSASGNYDAATRKAIVAFQKQQKLKASGLPDAATLLRLFNTDPKRNAPRKSR